MPEYPNKVSSVLERKYVSETNLNCIFVCLGDHIDFFCMMQELTPAPVFPLIVGVSVVALVISMPRFAAILQRISWCNLW